MLQVHWFCHPAIFGRVCTFALLAFAGTRRLASDSASATCLFTAVPSQSLTQPAAALVFEAISCVAGFGGRAAVVVWRLAARFVSHTSKPPPTTAAVLCWLL